MVNENIIGLFRRRYEYIGRVIEFYEKQADRLPDGKIRIIRHGEHLYYYKINDSKDTNGIILKGDEIGTVKDLAQKTYCKSILRTAYKEQRLLKRIMENYPDPIVEEIYNGLSKERQQLITPVKLTDEEYVEQWTSKKFKTKGIREGVPFFTTDKGEKVRSKSEQIIANRLLREGIPYKYECPLLIGDAIFHPDFTILRMSDRQEIYYEHCGMMDKADYADDTVNRINKYIKNNILLGDRLFLTYETKDTPLDLDLLDIMIEYQFR